MVTNFTRYVILLEELPGVATPRQTVHAHVQHLKKLDREGKLVMCGPFMNYKGGMVIINVPDIEGATQIAEADPFVKEGVRTYTLRSWELSCEDNNHLGMG